MRWYGRIGFTVDSDETFGIFEKTTTAKPYYGDVLYLRPRWEARDNSTNNDLVANVQLSVVADDFAIRNSSYMTWAEYMGAKWCITSIEVVFPRILINLGSVYTGAV